jgi:hypothetical protein
MGTQNQRTALEDYAMKLMCKTFIFGLAVAAASAAVSCSSGPKGKGGTPVTGEESGKIGLNLTFSTGETVPSLNFTLQNGTAADTVTGTIPITGTFSGTNFVVPTFEIIPVPVATGYWITLTGTSADGTVTCTGSDPATLPVSAANPGFGVTAGNETVVPVIVICTSTSSSGTVEVNTTIQSCPTISSLTAINATANTTAPGNTSTIFAAAAAPNQSTLTYTFSIPAGKGTGTLTGQTTATGNTSSSIVFTCPASAEVDTIQIVTTDQTGTTSCPPSITTASTTVTCGVPIIPCQNPTVGNGIEVTGDTATGTCTSGVNTGTLKDTNGFFCCSPTPCQGVGNGVETTGDTATGACTSGVNTGTLKDTLGNFCCSALTACTTAGQTNCVQCSLSTTGPTCTPTEAQFVNNDIAKGLDTAAGPAATGSCYQCLTAKGCIDDKLGDTGEECEDGTYAGPAPTSGDVAQCQAALKCVLASACNASSYSACYCGAATPSGTCLTDTTSSADPAVGSTANLNPATIGGACDVEISGGLGFSITDGTDILKNITSSTLAAGQVGAIFSCGVAAKCTACQ